jgi:hypothetical protein
MLLLARFVKALVSVGESRDVMVIVKCKVAKITDCLPDGPWSAQLSVNCDWLSRARASHPDPVYNRMDYSPRRLEV